MRALFQGPFFLLETNGRITLSKSLASNSASAMDFPSHPSHTASVAIRSKLCVKQKVELPQTNL
jgi:hypothetical protein